MFYKIIHFLQLPDVDTTLQLGKKQILIYIVTDFVALLACQIINFGNYNRLRVLSRVPTDDPEPIHSSSSDGIGSTFGKGTCQHPELPGAATMGLSMIRNIFPKHFIRESGSFL